VNHRVLSGLALLLLLASCVESGGERPPAARSPGIPTIDSEAVQKHADQFEDDLPIRLPGSQEEFAAATYITGHLQQAGYVVRLDSVPVANAVRSTNVVAVPASGDDPETIVTVSYDTARGKRDIDGSELGAFLELARALRAANDQHSVQFVALGAQSESALGSKRLARLLLDDELDPNVVHIAGPNPKDGLLAGGEFGSELTMIDCPSCVYADVVWYGVPDPSDPADPLVPIEEAGFSVTYVGGDGVRVARTLLTWLEESSR
jgi:hypothetical protein